MVSARSRRCLRVETVVSMSLGSEGRKGGEEKLLGLGFGAGFGGRRAGRKGW